MRLTAYQSPSGPRTAGVKNGFFVDLNNADPRVPHCIKELLSQGRDGLRLAAEALERGEPIPPENFAPLPVVPNPEKIICVGKNYVEHARETGAKPPAEPVIFNKFPSALARDRQPIILPTESDEVDYEAELVAVIGVGGWNIAEDRALEHVAGYCCGNDVSARDWQNRKPGGQWLLGKTFDTFAPIGPALVTADEIPDPQCLDIQLRLNGRVMQESNTRLMIFSLAELIAYVSRVCRLSPGDLFFTGTPAGVGFARRPPVFLQNGDLVEVEIERIGVLSNTVVSSA